MKNSSRDPSMVGEPIGWSDAQLEQLAQVSPADLHQAMVRWQIDAPPRYKSLLNAENDRTNDANQQQEQ